MECCLYFSNIVFVWRLKHVSDRKQNVSNLTQSDKLYKRNYFTWCVGIHLLYFNQYSLHTNLSQYSLHFGEIAYFVSSFLKGSIKSVQKVTYHITPYECVKSLTINPLSPHDALKHHFTSLKTDLIFLQPRVLERKFP